MSTILSQLKPLKIGDLTAKLPIIQGGMGVGISLSSLAGAVAGAGGIGIISTAQIGFREPDFAEHPQEANLRAIGSELQKARAIAKSVEGGIPARFRSSNSERIASRLFPVEIQIFQSWPFSWEGALVASSAIA